MADTPSPPAPVPRPSGRSLDRAALERVLARAGELQASGAEPSEALTEEELLALGNEVGLSPEFVRRALAEERNRIATSTETGLAARVAGPAWASAERVVAMPPAKALSTLDDWMQGEECLTVKRRFGDRLTWEARRDLFGNIKLTLHIGRRYHLAVADEISASAEPAGEGRTLVRLEALLRDARSSRIRQGEVVAGLGALGGAGFFGIAVLAHAFLLPAVAIAALPIAAGGAVGWALARGHGRVVTRAQLALEQALDRLEFGVTGRPTLGGLIAAVSRPTR
ncbi:MAG: hypothetical protein NVS9B3_14490 [Gemmatimonadaceae bacterium]